jgi:hypothetical protein
MHTLNETHSLVSIYKGFVGKARMRQGYGMEEVEMEYENLFEIVVKPHESGCDEGEQQGGHEKARIA